MPAIDHLFAFGEPELVERDDLLDALPGRSRFHQPFGSLVDRERLANARELRLKGWHHVVAGLVQHAPAARLTEATGEAHALDVTRRDADGALADRQLGGDLVETEGLLTQQEQPEHAAEGKGDAVARVELAEIVDEASACNVEFIGAVCAGERATLGHVASLSSYRTFGSYRTYATCNIIAWRCSRNAPIFSSHGSITLIIRREVPDLDAHDDEIWPALPYAEWQPTLATFHMWTQVVGKVKLELTPFLNEWWNVTFAVTARGLTTSTIPFGRRAFQVDFDLIDHRLSIHVSDGRTRSMPLVARSVADFYGEFMSSLESLGIQVRINTTPVEVDNPIPFETDRSHADYDARYVNRCWRILLRVSRLLEKYRTPFVGKSSPVQFWWGSFDLATTRFSGRPAPHRNWPARWMARGAEQEQALAGFWPGNPRHPDPAFVAYTFPEPPGCRTAAVQPDAAFFHPELSEFVLPYEKVRQSDNPDEVVLDFYRSTYEIGATLAGWDRAALERPAAAESD